jgi:hypothetical protein
MTSPFFHRTLSSAFPLTEGYFSPIETPAGRRINFVPRHDKTSNAPGTLSPKPSRPFLHPALSMLAGYLRKSPR